MVKILGVHHSGQYPALYDSLAITGEELIQLEYHLDNPNRYASLKFF